MGKGHPGRLCGRGRTRAGGPGEGRARAEGPHRPGKGRATGNRPPWRERAAAVGAVHCGKGQARPRRAFRERRRRPARRRAQGIVGRRRSGAGGGRWPAAPGRRARTAPAPPRPASDGAHAQRGGGRKRPGCRDDGVGPAARLSRSGPAAAGSPARPGPAQPMPRKALLCVLQLDVRSVSARAADPAALSRGAAGRRLEEKPRFAFPAPLPAPLPSLSRRPATPGPGRSSGRLARALLPSGGPPSGWKCGSALAPGQPLPLLCAHPPAAGPVSVPPHPPPRGS